jgi:hypothetical protein
MTIGAAAVRCALSAAIVLTYSLCASAQETVRVTAADTAVYLRPDPTSPVVLRVAVGTLLDVERRDGDWYPVVLPPDAQGLRRFGFVQASAVERVAPATPAERPPQRLPPAPPPAPLPEPEPPPPAPTDWAVEGGFVGITAPFHRARVNRADILINGADLLVFPNQSDTYGFGVVAGYMRERSTIEFVYVRSVHDSAATFLVPGARPPVIAFEGKSTYQRINIETKRFLARGWRAQPFLVFAVGFPWLTVKEGGLVGGSVVDGRFSGLGADAGGGLAFLAHRHVMAHVGIVYRYDFFLSARGGSLDWSRIKDLVTIRGIQVTTGVSYVF